MTSVAYIRGETYVGPVHLYDHESGGPGVGSTPVASCGQVLVPHDDLFLYQWPQYPHHVAGLKPCANGCWTLGEVVSPGDPLWVDRQATLAVVEHQHREKWVKVKQRPNPLAVFLYRYMDALCTASGHYYGCAYLNSWYHAGRFGRLWHRVWRWAIDHGSDWRTMERV